MLGLIKKDFLMIKGNSKVLAVVLFVFFLMALEGQFDASFAPTFIIVMLFMSTFSYDEYNKWDAYAITLPNGRKNIVKSKYIASLILILIAVIVTVLLNCLVGIINNSLEFDKFIPALIGGAFATVLIQAIMYPLIFKFGMEKGRIGLFVLVFAVTGIIELFSKVIKINIPTNLILFLNNYWFIIVPVTLVVILTISYKISEKIYLKKEF